MLFIEFSTYAGQMSHPQHKTKCYWKDVTLLQHCYMLTKTYLVQTLFSLLFLYSLDLMETLKTIQ